MIAMFPKDIQSIIQDPDRKCLSGIIFIDDMNLLKDLPTKINQDIKFVNREDWKVYEHYKINDKIIMNELGALDDTFQYIPKLNLSFEERRGNFQGYHLKAMTEEESPYIIFSNLSSAEFDQQSQTYDVTKSVQGLYYDMFLILQETLNFTATLHKREDGKWGPLTVFGNGTIVADGIVESVISGFSEMIVTR